MLASLRRSGASYGTYDYLLDDISDQLARLESHSSATCSVALRTPMQLAPPRVTISRPKTAAALSGDGAARSASESGPTAPLPRSATLTGRRANTAFEHHGRQTKLATTAASSNSSHANGIGAPTRPPARPASSMSRGKAVVPSHRASATTSSSRRQENSSNSASRVQSATPAPQLPLSAPFASSADTTGNIYLAMAARKSAEDTAKQLARRIAHFRAQEERVLREVQQVKSQLESALVATHPQPSHSTRDSWADTSDRVRQGWFGHDDTAALSSRVRTRREPHVPRSRDQLQFLTVRLRLLDFLDDH